MSRSCNTARRKGEHVKGKNRSNPLDDGVKKFEL